MGADYNVKSKYRGRIKCKSVKFKVMKFVNIFHDESPQKRWEEKNGLTLHVNPTIKWFKENISKCGAAGGDGEGNESMRGIECLVMSACQGNPPLSFIIIINIFIIFITIQNFVCTWKRYISVENMDVNTIRLHLLSFQCPISAYYYIKG